MVAGIVFGSGFYFGAGFIYLERSIEFHVPKKSPSPFTAPALPPETSDSGNEHICRWTGSQLRSPTAKEDDDTPHDKTPPVAWTTFPS